MQKSLWPGASLLGRQRVHLTVRGGRGAFESSPARGHSHRASVRGLEAQSQASGTGGSPVGPWPCCTWPGGLQMIGLHRQAPTSSLRSARPHGRPSCSGHGINRCCCNIRGREESPDVNPPLPEAAETLTKFINGGGVRRQEVVHFTAGIVVAKPLEDRLVGPEPPPTKLQFSRGPRK